MESNLRDILEFSGNARVAALVSQGWRQEILENEQAIMDGLERQYPDMDVYQIASIIIQNNDIEAIRRLSLIRSSINWNDVAYLLMKEGSDQAVSIILPLLNENNRITVAGRRGITLRSYPYRENSTINTSSRDEVRMNNIYQAISLGDAQMLLQLTPMGNHSDANITWDALEIYMKTHGIVPKTIMDSLLYRYTEGNYIDLIQDTQFAAALKEVMRVYTTNGDPPEDWIDATDALDHWHLQGQIYMSLTLSNDDLTSFKKAMKYIQTDDVHKIVYTAGPKIISYIRYYPPLLHEILNTKYHVYQPLDMQYFVNNIIQVSDTDLDRWVNILMKIPEGRRIRYGITDVSDAIRFVKSTRYRAMNIALMNGWTHLIYNHINRDNIIGVVSMTTRYGEESRWQLPEKSIYTLRSLGINPISFISILEDPSQKIDRSIWTSLLATAVAYRNRNMIKTLMTTPHELSSQEKENLLNIISIHPENTQLQLKRILQM